ncbi:MAG: hypothetical protein QXP34_02400 [Candidatus Aenigmatarchaeota archaeon]
MNTGKIFSKEIVDQLFGEGTEIEKVIVSEDGNKIEIKSKDGRSYLITEDYLKNLILVDESFIRGILYDLLNSNYLPDKFKDYAKRMIDSRNYQLKRVVEVLDMTSTYVQAEVLKKLGLYFPEDYFMWLFIKYGVNKIEKAIENKDREFFSSSFATYKIKEKKENYPFLNFITLLKHYSNKY